MRLCGVVLALFLLSQSVKAQIYSCKDGHIGFTSEAPLEMIKAQSTKAIGALDCTNKNVVFSINIDSFDGFNSSLQKEHFRENYMETTRFPNALFKGKIIEDIDFSKKGTYNIRAKGVFSIHGVDKEKIVKVKVIVKDNIIEVEASFDVPLEDHNIKIPKVVNQKIASVIMVEVKASLKPKA